MAPAPPPQTSASSVLNSPTSITTLLPITVAKALETGSASRIPSIEILPPKSTSAPKSIPTSTFSTSIISKTSSTISSTATASATSTADKGIFTRPSGNLTAIITMIIVAIFVAYCVIRCCICKSMRKRKELERERGDLERERVRQMREREAIEMAGRMRESSRERMRKDGWEDVLLHGRHVG
ncbi:uncharacterized protein EAE97_011795 [Botrytis byssoidea]|uniref:Transmembrane protein n=1 Tax=Botrytis byssoidea TaxID=139641 RepID=A0A9P5HP39_9HELO|nr:uncharacterized protein EAE97_011795 [Botrytis byssoidea]KAF7918700.1 hypothetical protein EAE97_011795 [Botrytis byssoidea]